MLGKVGWRLAADPNALICQVLKAKYYPMGDFLNANIGHSPSFTWRNICSSQDLLQKGIRWRIGSGDGVLVYRAPWLRRNNNFFVTSDRHYDLLDMKVSDLIIPGTRSWDIEHIMDLFDINEAEEILKIPLSPNPTMDKIIWHFSRRGVYSVKSAYDLACSLTINEVNEGAQELESFVVAESSPEEESWSVAGFMQVIRQVVDKFDSFVDFFFNLLDHEDKEGRDKMCMILWQIWKDCNAAVWNNIIPNSQHSQYHALSNRNEWLAAQFKAPNSYAGQNNSLKCTGWHDLPHGWFHCGVDAAFFETLGLTGIGIILRDERGNFVAAKVRCFSGCMQVDEGEAMGVYETLSWIKERGIEKAMIETDCQIVLD